ncbi:MAG TPA: M50 family metallopeptidase [Acidimicrobiales bacterium]|nr:M50 family metallopeptidase [Acidimicrobiales bacterium]
MTDTEQRTDAAGADEAAAPQAEPTAAEQRSAFVRLVMVLLAAALATVVTRTTKTVLVVVALIVMIMLHEFGHYLTAKLGHMKVTEFFVGFGPRLWSVRKGETEYGVKALPVGGYVKIIGMHNLDRIEDPADEPRTYRQQPFPQRLAVAVAGSTMHFLIAFLLFFTINAFVGVPSPSLRIGEISKISGSESPAQLAGIQLGDRVVSVDGHQVSSWDELPPYIRKKPGQAIQLVVERNGQRVPLSVTPVDLSQVKVEGMPATATPTGFVGIGPKIEFDKVNPLVAFGRAGRQFVGGDYPNGTQVAPGLVDNAAALGHIFSPKGVSGYFHTLTSPSSTATPEDGGTRFLSPVGFVRVAGQAANTGLFEVLLLLIAINLFVGLFNLLPLLPLDGGHVVIAVYEAIRSKIRGRRYYVDVAKLLPITYAVVMILVFLGVSALYLDIVHPLNFK